jgi:transcription antitermination factor NusG
MTAMYWACAQLEGNRERLALHCLQLGGFTTYLPRVLERRRVNGRQVTATPALFPGYAFVLIEMQWHQARWTPGIIRLVMDGRAAGWRARPGHRRPQEASATASSRLLPPPDFQRGDRVRITRGIFAGQLAPFDGMRPRERVAVLLQLLGPVELPKDDIVSA